MKQKGLKKEECYNAVGTNHFRTAEEIDLYLDMDTGTMKLCVATDDGMSQDGKRREAILYLAGKGKGVEWENKGEGFVPHFNFGSTGHRMVVRMAKIPMGWYGIKTGDG